MHTLLIVIATGTYGTRDVLDALDELHAMGAPWELIDEALAMLELRAWNEIKNREKDDMRQWRRRAYTVPVVCDKEEEEAA